MVTRNKSDCAHAISFIFLLITKAAFLRCSLRIHPHASAAHFTCILYIHAMQFSGVEKEALQVYSACSMATSALLTNESSRRADSFGLLLLHGQRRQMSEPTNNHHSSPRDLHFGASTLTSYNIAIHLRSSIIIYIPSIQSDIPLNSTIFCTFSPVSSKVYATPIQRDK